MSQPQGYTVRLIGLASGAYRTPFDGRYLVDYDPTRAGRDPAGRPMTARIVATADRSQARLFPTAEAAWAEWRRESGLPYPRNAPLTAYTIEVAAITTNDDGPPNAFVPWAVGQS